MDIYSEPGTKVIFENPDNGWSHDQEKAKAHLTVGEMYTVQITEVHSSHSHVILKEFPGIKFNTVMFENA